MAEIVWSVQAAEDIEDIAQYIALDKPDAASHLVAKVIDSIDQLADFPQKGRIVPELNSDRFREVIVGPCRVIYSHQRDAVHIVRIVRGEMMVYPGMVIDSN